MIFTTRGVPRGRSIAARHAVRSVRLTRVELSAANRDDALTASGSIPLVCDPVVDVAGAPPGDYWDGGLIDYHLLLPHSRLDGVVLYPHFAPRVTPGWLDKFLPWRKHPVAHPWLDNMLLIAPSPAFVVTLPRARLPERQDFYHYGTDHASRIAAWTRAMRECERFADEAMAFLERPRKPRPGSVVCGTDGRDVHGRFLSRIHS